MMRTAIVGVFTCCAAAKVVLLPFLHRRGNRGFHSMGDLDCLDEDSMARILDFLPFKARARTTLVCKALYWLDRRRPSQFEHISFEIDWDFDYSFVRWLMRDTLKLAYLEISHSAHCATPTIGDGFFLILEQLHNKVPALKTLKLHGAIPDIHVSRRRQRRSGVMLEIMPYMIALPLKAVGMFPTLTELCLSRWLTLKNDARHFLKLTALVNLQALVLLDIAADTSGTVLGDNMQEVLRQLVQLTRLELIDLGGYGFWHMLRQPDRGGLYRGQEPPESTEDLLNLRSLVVTGCRGVDVWPVARMTNLTSLRIELDAEHFEELFLGLAALRTLKIKFDGSALPRPLRLAPNVLLTSLHLAPFFSTRDYQWNQGPIDGILPFHRLESLKELSLGMTPKEYLPTPDIFSDLTELTCLRMRHPGIAVRRQIRIPSLQRLDLI